MEKKPSRSVAGIAVDKAGRIFVARRLPAGVIGGKWEFPGGKVENHETDCEALQRELLEEFAVAVEVGPLLASGQFQNNQKTILLKAYRISFQSANFSMTEHSEWRWVPFQELAQLDFANSDRQLFEELYRNLFTKLQPLEPFPLT